MYNERCHGNHYAIFFPGCSHNVACVCEANRTPNWYNREQARHHAPHRTLPTPYTKQSSIVNHNVLPAATTKRLVHQTVFLSRHLPQLGLAQVQLRSPCHPRHVVTSTVRTNERVAVEGKRISHSDHPSRGLAWNHIFIPSRPHFQLRVILASHAHNAVVSPRTWHRS